MRGHITAQSAARGRQSAECCPQAGELLLGPGREHHLLRQDLVDECGHHLPRRPVHLKITLAQAGKNRRAPCAVRLPRLQVRGRVSQEVPRLLDELLKRA